MQGVGVRPGHIPVQELGLSLHTVVEFTLALSNSRGLKNSFQTQSSRPNTWKQMLDHSSAHWEGSDPSALSGVPTAGWQGR